MKKFPFLQHEGLTSDGVWITNGHLFVRNEKVRSTDKYVNQLIAQRAILTRDSHSAHATKVSAEEWSIHSLSLMNRVIADNKDNPDQNMYLTCVYYRKMHFTPNPFVAVLEDANGTEYGIQARYHDWIVEELEGSLLASYPDKPISIFGKGHEWYGVVMPVRL